MWLPIVMRKQAAVIPTFPLHGSHYVTHCTFSGCAREREMVFILLQIGQVVLTKRNWIWIFIQIMAAKTLILELNNGIHLSKTFIVKVGMWTCAFNYHYFSVGFSKMSVYSGLMKFCSIFSQHLQISASTSFNEFNQFNVWLVWVTHFVKLGERTDSTIWWRILPHLPPLFSWLCSKGQHVETFSLMNNTCLNQRWFLHFSGRCWRFAYHWLCIFALFSLTILPPYTAPCV